MIKIMNLIRLMRSISQVTVNTIIHYSDPFSLVVLITTDHSVNMIKFTLSSSQSDHIKRRLTTLKANFKIEFIHSLALFCLLLLLLGPNENVLAYFSLTDFAKNREKTEKESKKRTERQWIDNRSGERRT